MLNDFEIDRLSFESNLISPYDKRLLQPASYDLTLGTNFKLESLSSPGEWIDVNNTELIIFSHEFVLAHSVERLTLPQNVVGFVHGRSSIGRTGLQIHCAGLIDPGFTNGEITFELFNQSRNKIHLKAGMSIAQVCFQVISPATIKNYAKTGNYNNQSGATISVLNLT